MSLNVQQTRVEITAVDKTKDAFDSVRRGFDGIARDYLGLTTVLSGGGFALLVKSTIDAADAMHDLSTQTGISVESLGAWALAADQSNTSMEDLAAAMAKGSKYIVEHGDKLKALGITAKNSEDLIYQLAGIISKLPSDDPRRVALAMEVLGKSAAGLVPLLAEGEDGLRRMVARGKELNPVTSEIADNADKFKDQLSELKLVSSGLFVNLVSNILPSLNTYLTDMRAIIESGDWIDKLLFFTVGYVPGKVADKTHDPVEQIKRYDDAIANLKARMAQFPNSGTLQSGFQKEMDDLIAGRGTVSSRLPTASTTPSLLISSSKDLALAALQKQLDAALAKPGETKLTDYQKLTQAIREKIAASQQELLIGQPLSDSEKLISKLYADRASGAIKISDAEQRVLEVSYKKLGVLDKQGEQEKAVQKALQTSQDEYDKQSDSINQNVLQTQLQTETYGKSASAITENTIAHLEEKKSLLENIGVYGEAIGRINDLIDANKKLVKSQRDLEAKDIMAQYAHNRQAYFEGMDQQILMLKEQNQLYGLTETQIARVNLQRAQETKLKFIANGGADADYLYDLQREIDLRQQMVQQIGSLEEKRAWTDIFNSIESTAHDTFISIFDSGKSAFDRLRDALKNGLLDLLYQLTFKKWIVNISAAVTGGASGAALASTASAGDSGITSILSGGSKLLDGITNGFSSLQTGLQSSIEHLGAFLSTGNGGLGDVIGGALGQYSSQIANILPYSGAVFSLLKGDIKGAAIQGVATAIGSFTPLGPVGGAIIGAVASSLLGGAFGSHVSRPKYYADTLVGQGNATTLRAYGNSDASGNGGGVAINAGLGFGGAINQYAAIFGGSINNPFKLGVDYQKKYNNYGLAIGSAITKNGSNADFRFAPGQESAAAADAFLIAVKKGLVTLPAYLQAIVQRSTFDLNSAQGAVGALSAYMQLNAALKDLPPVFNSIGDAIKNLASTNNIATVQARFAAINTYTSLFYSDQEKLGTFTKQLNSAFGSLNVALPDTRDGFRSLVDGIDTTNASGLSLFNSLVDLAPTMDTYYKALQSQADVTNQAADAAKQLADNLSTDGFSNLVDYTRAQKYIINGTTLPSFDVGTNFVPNDMTAKIHAGERIVTAADNRELMARLRNPQAASSALADEIRQLRAELAQLRAEQFAAGVAISNSTAAMSSKLSRWDGDGMPPVRS